MSAEPAEPMPEHASNFALDRLIAGTGDVAMNAKVKAHLEHCSSCRERHRTLEEDRARFAPDAALLERLAGPAQAEAKVIPFRARARLVQGLVPALAAAALLFVVTRRPGDETATKGGAIYEVFVKDANGTRAVTRGAVVHPGDVVQVTRTGTSAGFVGLYCVDGAGSFTRFIPQDGQQLAAIQAGAQVALPQSIQLDDTPGTERFIMVDCDQPTAAALAEELAKGGSLQPGCSVIQTSLEKR